MGEMGETAQKSSTLKYIIQNTIRYNFVAHNMNFDSNITTNQQKEKDKQHDSMKNHIFIENHNMYFEIKAFQHMLRSVT